MGLLAKPPFGLLIMQIEGWKGALYHFCILIENVFENLVYSLVGKEISSILSLHEIKENCIDRKAYKLAVTKRRGNMQHSIDHFQNLLSTLPFEVVADAYPIFP